METKVFEVRDRLTFIPIMAIRLNQEDPQERYLVRQSGWTAEFIFARINNMHFTMGIEWQKDRTLGTVTRHIRENWNNLISGEVIDVEFVLGEVSKPKRAQRLDDTFGEFLLQYAPR